MLNILFSDFKGPLSFKNHPEILRFKGYEFALLVSHEMISREMKTRSYKDSTPIQAFFNDHYIFPNPNWPPFCGYASETRDLVEVAKKWLSWADRHNWICWNKGREPLFHLSEFGSLSAQLLDLDSLLSVEQKVYDEFTEIYSSTAERMMNGYDVEFASLVQEATVEIVQQVKTIVNGETVVLLEKGIQATAWVDPRSDKRSPALVVNPSNGRPEKLSPAEFIVVRTK